MYHLPAKLSLYQCQFRNSVLPIGKCSRNLFTFNKDNEEKVVLTEDGSTIVCWHPEKPFPYECSKPLPEVVKVENSVLKIENKEDIYKVFKQKTVEETQAELMKITYTTKHRWYPRARDKRAKTTLRNRPYL